MAEKYDGPLAFPPVGYLYPLKVLELAAVINGDAFEQGIEQLPEFLSTPK